MPPEVDPLELAETEIGQHDFEKGTKDGVPNDPAICQSTSGNCR